MIDIQAIDIWTAGVLQDHEIVPNAIDLINFDEKNRHKAEILGIPPKIINSLVDVANIRREKAKAQAEAEAQAKTAALADAAKKGAGAVKDLANAPMGQDTALDRSLNVVSGAS